MTVSALKNFDRNWFRFVFVFILSIGLVWCLITPPFQVADENFHFLRAYQVATGEFFPLRTESGKLLAEHKTVYASDKTFIYRFRKVEADSGSFPVNGGFLPARIPEISNHLIEKIPHDPDKKLSARKLMDTFRKDLGNNGNNIVFVSFPNTAAYSAVVYLPQALGILVAKSLHLNLLYGFYLARITAVMFGAAAIAFGIAILPWAKIWFCFFSLVPMLTFQLASCSADSTAITLSLLFVCIVLALSEQPKLDTPLLYMASIVWAILFLSKTVYAGLAILLIPAIWSHRHEILKGSNVLILPFSICCALPGLFWADAAMKSFVPPASYIMADPYAQKSFILHNLSFFATSMFEGLVKNYQLWYKQGTGVFGWLDTHSSGLYYLTTLVGLIVLIFADAPRKKNYMLLTISIVTALAVYMLIAFSISLIWNPVGVMMVNGIQGRYLLPVVPCLAIFIRMTNSLTIPFVKLITLRQIMTAVVLVMQFASFEVVISRYWKW